MKWPKRKKRSTRNERRWKEVARIVGPGVHKLPESFRHGLYHLRNRSGLPDPELVLAFNRCKAWLARAKNGVGECECCGMKLPIEAVNTRGQSVWALDHDPRTKTFRGILYFKCNLEIAEGDRQRKWAHASYIDAHQARIRSESTERYAANEFLRVTD